MELFLQILGALFLLVLLLIASGFFLIRWKIKQAIGSLVGGMNDMASLPPAQITLARQSTPDWNDAEAIDNLAEPLRTQGFHNAGIFEIEDLPVTLQAFVHPTDCLYAVVYEHEQVGVYADILTEYSNGTLTVSSAPNGHELEHPPGHEKIYLRGASIEELLTRLKQERKIETYRPVSIEEFKTKFEQFYAEEMEWRFTQGGASEEEIRRIAQESNITLNEETLAQQLEWNQRHAAQNLTPILQQRFLQKGTLNAAEWEQARERLVIVHERLTPEMVREIIVEWTEEGDEEDVPAINMIVPAGLGARESFRLLNERLPSAQRFEKIDELDEPVAADVYVAAED